MYENLNIHIFVTQMLLYYQFRVNSILLYLFTKLHRMNYSRTLGVSNGRVLNREVPYNHGGDFMRLDSLILIV